MVIYHIVCIFNRGWQTWPFLGWLDINMILDIFDLCQWIRALESKHDSWLMIWSLRYLRNLHDHILWIMKCGSMDHFVTWWIWLFGMKCGFELFWDVQKKWIWSWTCGEPSIIEIWIRTSSVRFLQILSPLGHRNLLLPHGLGRSRTADAQSHSPGLRERMVGEGQQNAYGHLGSLTWVQRGMMFVASWIPLSLLNCKCHYLQLIIIPATD